MQASGGKVRIQDIAQAAGVSISTASNVLSGKRQVNSRAGQRVLEIARQMGYSQQSFADFKKAVHFVIYKKHGRVVMDTPFFSELIGGIEYACKARGYTFCISYVDQSGDASYRARLSAILADHSMPMLLLATEMSTADIAPFREYAAPLVVIDSLFQTERLNTVCIDNFTAGYQAGAALTEAGHRRVGLVTSSLPFNNTLDRQRGLKAALGQAGLSLDPGDVFTVEPTMEGAYADMCNLLNRRTASMPTGVFAANDIIAFGVLRALSEHGMSVPRDVSIVGMDNMPVSRITSPSLSTLDVPKREIGLISVERLIRMAEEPDGLYMKTLVGTEYIGRESVAPPQE